jgi:hypothetical protein
LLGWSFASISLGCALLGCMMPAPAAPVEATRRFAPPELAAITEAEALLADVKARYAAFDGTAMCPGLVQSFSNDYVMLRNRARHTEELRGAFAEVTGRSLEPIPTDLRKHNPLAPNFEILEGIAFWSPERHLPTIDRVGSALSDLRYSVASGRSDPRRAAAVRQRALEQLAPIRVELARKAYAYQLLLAQRPDRRPLEMRRPTPGLACS